MSTDKHETRATLVAEIGRGMRSFEGVRVTDAASFALGVQWHPEWEPAKSSFSTALFRSFGDAARARKARR